MGDISKRLAALSPEQRKLLEKRLRREGLSDSLAQGTPAAAQAGPPARGAGEGAGDTARGGADREVQFSLFFFSADGSSTSAGKYRLLLESAKFADRHGFAAVWTPERHFQDFGGLYPNPSVLGAALAASTERVQIRAGSVVLPLHHPVRVVEEWSVVDNLSGGRAAISCASGWHPSDFIFAPHDYAERHDVMFDHIETVRRLWAGEALRFRGVNGAEVEVRTMPRPVQPELPLWVTSAGNTRTWERAGEVGANILATMGSQPLGDLAKKIRLYREARSRAGHDPQAGTVSLMLHTFIGDDLAEVREKVRAPLTAYLRTHIRQRDAVLEVEGITHEDEDALVRLAFEHYFENASLIGTLGKCARMVERLRGVGVDEIACLVDFGLDFDEVMKSLSYVSGLREAYGRAARVGTQHVG